MRLDYRASSTEKIKAGVSKSALFASLRDKTPDEIDSWVDSNVKSIDDVKDLLKELLKAVSLTVYSIKERKT